MKLIKITNGKEIIYENNYNYDDYSKVQLYYRRLSLSTLKDHRPLTHIFFNNNDNDNLIDINGPFYVKIKEDIGCYNEWEVDPTKIKKDTELFIELINIRFGITKYMLGFKYVDSGSNAIHYIDPEHVDFVKLESEKNDSESEVENIDKNNEPGPEVKEVSKSNRTKPKIKSKTTSRKTKSATKNTNISKKIKNICDISKPGITLDDENLKNLNESINDDVNKLCVLIERKDKINKIISALSKSSKNIKISDSDFNLNVKIVSLDLDIQIPSSHLFETKDINKLVLEYHKKEYDSIKTEIENLKGLIFRNLDILLTGEEK